MAQSAKGKARAARLVTLVLGLGLPLTPLPAEAPRDSVSDAPDPATGAVKVRICPDADDRPGGAPCEAPAGFELRARVVGEGSPAVVFDTGLGDNLTTWRALPDRIATHVRVVTYDRAGLGESDPGGRDRSGVRVVRELRALLAALKVEPPYILVGHSLGGLHLLIFADRYPQDVAGLVFLDPTTAEMFGSLETEEGWETYKSQMEGYPEGVRAEGLASRQRLRTVRGLGDPPDLPAVVISGTKPPFIPEEQREAMAEQGLTEETWRQAQTRKIGHHRDLAEHFPRGRFVAAEEAHHYVHWDQPELVLEEILALVRELQQPPESPPARP